MSVPADTRQTIREQAVPIARCPEHGLHGERATCFVCGTGAEQIPMVPLATLDDVIILNRVQANKISKCLYAAQLLAKGYGQSTTAEKFREAYAILAISDVATGGSG